jgi:phosphoribosylformimino-5-aminoimidazole carboxamide ribotide isomerase
MYLFHRSVDVLNLMAEYACEFLVHAADVEGLCRGIDADLVTSKSNRCSFKQAYGSVELGEWSPIPCTYAGGGKSLDDLETVARLSNDRVDLTFGRYVTISVREQLNKS